MKRVTILSLGRQDDPPLRKLREDYYRRCGRLFEVEERLLRDLRSLGAALPGRGALVVLDGRGEAPTSPLLARKLRGWLERPDGGPTFVIGGASGLDEETRRRADEVISLGPLTLPHRLVRLVLAEQLYRAVSILEGMPYHRGR